MLLGPWYDLSKIKIQHAGAWRQVKQMAQPKSDWNNNFLEEAQNVTKKKQNKTKSLKTTAVTAPKTTKTLTKI